MKTIKNYRGAVKMKNIKIINWILVGIVALYFLITAFSDLSHTSQVVEIVTKLGYPEYFLNILGIAKALGIIALLVPKFNRLKEWAYAGFTFDAISAIWSNIASGYPSESIAAVVAIVLLMASYIVFRKLNEIRKEPAYK
ncbi:putative membrane protein [Paenibacillus sp. V4I3]|uniref:DoxX family protein n=1 Tax=unclassified Paenibacillus TaxID=185978 RepID=UPI0027855DA9|nr:MULTISPECIES: DoxX family protein [unclassified Paenibacillus]MDQ0874368.1 putative membrane protein [Paenibacillus sp. V4I3]MDQ0897436.1 putative membrane protein [Paenibacillus sp. V4I7]